MRRKIIQMTLLLIFTISVIIPATSPSSVYAAQTSTFYPAADTWLSSGTSTPSTTTLIANGTSKIIYMAYDVKGIFTQISSVKMKLYYNNGGTTSNKIKVFCTYNGWDESSINWSNKTPAKPETPLVQANLPSGAGYMTLDLGLKYVVGTGRYSFRIETDAAADVSFNSNQSALNKPMLQVAYETYEDYESSSYYIDAGKFHEACYEDAKDAKDGFFVATKAPYYADNTGVKDATLALQRLINDARAARCVVYLPAGTYKVSDTIQCINPNAGNVIVNETKLIKKDFGNILRGPEDPAKRAVIKLADNAQGFNNPTSPKPVFLAWGRTDRAPYVNEKQNVNWAQHFINIDLDLNGVKGNSGAIGIDLTGCEYCSIQGVNVTATGAYAGIAGGLGSGGASHKIKVIGGQYGLYVDPAQPSPVYSYLTCIGQTKACVYSVARGPLTLVGAVLEPLLGAKAVESYGNVDTQPWNGGVNLIDGKVTLASGNTEPAIYAKRSIYLNNTYVKNAETIVKVDNESIIRSVKGNANGWSYVKEAAVNARVRYETANTYDGTTQRDDRIYIDGQKSTEPVYDVVTTGITDASIPATLQTRHHWNGIIPFWGDAGVLNARDYGAVGDGKADDYLALQKAIDDASAKNQALFIPKGAYMTSKTLELKANSIVFGNYSWYVKILPLIQPDNPNCDFLDENNPQPVMRTVDDAEATTYLTNVMLYQQGDPPTGGKYIPSYALLWRAGRNSVINNIALWRDVYLSVQEANGPLVIFNGHGGGRIYNLQASEGKEATVNFRQWLIDGTTEPMYFYHVNPAAAHRDDPPDDTLLATTEIRNAKNIEIYGIKYESRTSCVYATNSSNIRIFGDGGAGGGEEGDTTTSIGSVYYFKNCKDFLVSNINQQIGTDRLMGNSNFLMDDQVICNNAYQVTLYKRGNPVQVEIINKGSQGVTPPITFKDVKSSDWFYNTVNYLVAKGVLNGYSDGTFQPGGNVNVDAFIKMTVTALGYTEITNSSGYWANNFINKAKELGLVEDGDFSVYTRAINRGEMARIIARALKARGETMPTNMNDNIARIKDYSKIKTEVRSYVLQAFTVGIITGYPDGTFQDLKNATRSEAATMIARLIDPAQRKG